MPRHLKPTPSKGFQGTTHKASSVQKKPLAIGIALALSMTAANALAATINVNSASGEMIDSTKCTLRSAVIAANSDASSGGCVAGSGNDTIDLSAIAGQTVTLSGDSVQITSAMTIDGQGATISGNNNLRVFEATGVANTTLNDLIISAGSADNGAGINVNTGATLTLNRSTISGNTASVFGGGVFAQTGGTININQSTISGNKAYAGGGVGAYNYGTVNLNNSTISGNSATNYGGGIFISESEANLLHTTVASNTVSAGTYYAGGGVYLRTINNVGELSLTNSIIAGSDGGVTGAEDCDSNTAPSVATDGVNLVRKGAGCGLTAIPGVMLTSDPLLGTLADNGGPTLTHAIHSNSPAQDPDPGNCPGFEVDQRNFVRTGQNCDLGAFEYGAVASQSGPDFVVTSSDDVDDGVCGDVLASEHCSLREAINASNANPDASTITFANSLLSPSPATITLAGTELPQINSTVTIQGSGITIDADGRSRVLSASSATLTLNDLTLTNGYINNGNGGCLHAGNSDVRLERVRVSNCESRDLYQYFDTLGGGVFADNTDVYIVDSTLSGNFADIGGAIFQLGSEPLALAIKNSTISGNTARFGSAIYSWANIAITNGTIVDNSGNSTIFTYRNNQTLTLANTILESSASQSNCSGFTLDLRAPSIVSNNGNCSLNSNSLTPLPGPALLGPLADNGGPTLTHMPAANSPAINAGDNAQVYLQPFDQRGESRISAGIVDIGAVEVQQPLQNGPNFVVTTSDDSDFGKCEVAPGHCSLREAVIAANADPDASTITFANSLLSPSPATITLAGSELPQINSTVTIQGSGITIDADGESRVLSANSATLTLNDLTLTNAYINGNGGCLHASYSDVRLERVRVSDCSVNGPFAVKYYVGGGIFASNTELLIVDSTLSGNRSSDSGGAIYHYGSLPLVIISSTISGNTAPDGSAIHSSSNIVITNGTIVDNYGSADIGTFDNSRTLTLANTILESSAYFGNCAGFTLTLTAPSIISNIGDCILNGLTPLPGPALLGPLADNGGPTLTHMPAANSPAINAGDNAFVPDGVDFDQRGAGFPRIQGVVDIGAVERQPLIEVIFGDSFEGPPN